MNLAGRHPTSSSFLFVMVMDFVMRSVLCEDDGFIVVCRRNWRHLGIRLTCLTYTDNDILICCDPDAVQRAICRIAKEGKQHPHQHHQNRDPACQYFERATTAATKRGIIVVCRDFKYPGFP